MSNLAERVTKVSYKKGDWTVETTHTYGKTEKAVRFKSRETCHPDLSVAFNKLVGSVREICEFPDSLYAGKITIGGVSWSLSENTGVEGAVLSFLVELEGSNAPAAWNTPHLPYDQYNEEGPEQPTLPADTVEALEILRREALAYAKGEKRAQSDLFVVEGGAVAA